VEQAVAQLAVEKVTTDLHHVEGALSVDEALNFDRDGQARYFGSTSGRLVFSDSQSTGITNCGLFVVEHVANCSSE
jgi:hypothetical protein